MLFNIIELNKMYVNHLLRFNRNKHCLVLSKRVETFSAFSEFRRQLYDIVEP